MVPFADGRQTYIITVMYRTPDSIAMTTSVIKQVIRTPEPCSCLFPVIYEESKCSNGFKQPLLQVTK